MRTAAVSAMATGRYSDIPFHRGTRDLLAFSFEFSSFWSQPALIFTYSAPSPDSLSRPIRSAIILARFVFPKATTKTPFLDYKSLPVPPLVVPAVILEAESEQKVRHTYCFSAARRSSLRRRARR